MKKKIAILLSAVMFVGVLALTACGGNKPALSFLLGVTTSIALMACGGNKPAETTASKPTSGGLPIATDEPTDVSEESVPR